MKRRRHSREQWLKWLVEQPQSGLSIARFCDAKGVGEQSFYLWRQKLRKELKRAGRTSEKRSGNGATPFVPVEVIGLVGQVDIELPGGAVAKVPADENAVRLVLKVLLELGTQS